MMHIGNRIRRIFDEQPKNHNATWLAEALNCQRGNIYKIFRRQNMDVKTLMHLSRALNHDFFEDLSKAYRAGDTEDFGGGRGVSAES